MAYYVYSLESRRGHSNENTQYTIMLKKIEKISLLCLLTRRYDKHSLALTTPILRLQKKSFDLMQNSKQSDWAAAQTDERHPFPYSP